MAKIICFDLEGPLSPQDNAYEVMGLFGSGHRIFECISRYDDILTLENRPNYEPGDTLALILPFLLFHGINEDSIRKVSGKARLVDGAKELVTGLMRSGWDVYIISTSYEQHAFHIGSLLGVPGANIRCTKFPLDSYSRDLDAPTLKIVERIEQQLLALDGPDGKDEQLKEILDGFYWKTLLRTPIGDVMERIRVIGGSRKVDAAAEIARGRGCALADIVVVGDSITDFKMLKEVNGSGGLAVAFNANAFALPHANVALASEKLSDLRDVLEAWSDGGRSAVLEEVERIGKHEQGEPKLHYTIIDGKTNMQDVIQVHGKYRALVRGKAAKLG